MIRIAKILIAAAAGVLLFFVGLDNVFDYDTNFVVVKHILSMDAVPTPNPFAWRAVTDPAIHQACYWFIIVTEFIAALLAIYGALRLWAARSLSDGTFNREKSFAVAGLALAFGLYFFGFMAVGGEWFEMWRAVPWNMQEPAFRFIGGLGLAMLFINQRD